MLDDKPWLQLITQQALAKALVKRELRKRTELEF
jgi:hypothetical protein